MPDRAAKPATSFGAHAQDYDRYRPGYAAAAVDWALEGVEPGGLVLDVGAGTGILAAAAQERGFRILAVEPDPRMCSVAATRLDAGAVVNAAAEAMPVADGSANAIVVGQAWHWFEHDAACAEFARVLAPGGTLAVLWNLRDPSCDWLRSVEDATGLPTSRAQASSDAGLLLPRELFGPETAASFGHALSSSREHAMALFGTYSLVYASADPERVMAAIAGVLDTHPQTAGLPAFDFPFTTTVLRAQRLQ